MCVLRISELTMRCDSASCDSAHCVQACTEKGHDEISCATVSDADGEGGDAIAGPHSCLLIGNLQQDISDLESQYEQVCQL